MTSHDVMVSRDVKVTYDVTESDVLIMQYEVPLSRAIVVFRDVTALNGGSSESFS